MVKIVFPHPRRAQRSSPYPKHAPTFLKSPYSCKTCATLNYFQEGNLTLRLVRANDSTVLAINDLITVVSRYRLVSVPLLQAVALAKGSTAPTRAPAHVLLYPAEESKKKEVKGVRFAERSIDSNKTVEVVRCTPGTFYPYQT